MGIYDYITSEYPLPDGYEHQKLIGIQTKSFSCEERAFRHFVIMSTGKLLEQKYIASPKERTYNDTDYTGILSFGDTTEEGFREYSARFEQGKLVGIYGGLGFDLDFGLKFWCICQNPSAEKEIKQENNNCILILCSHPISCDKEHEDCFDCGYVKNIELKK